MTAESGEMHVTPDDRYFILDLVDGYQYQEPESEQDGGNRSYPFVRTKFGAYRKTFDLGEFEIERTEEGAFQGHSTMLSVRQLWAAIDSIEGLGKDRVERLGIEIGRFVHPLKTMDRAKQDSIDRMRQDSIKRASDIAFAAAQEAGTTMTVDSLRVVEGQRAEALPVDDDWPSAMRPHVLRQRRDEGGATSLDRAFGARTLQIDSTNRDYVGYFLSQPQYKQVGYTDRALQQVRTIRSYTDGAARRLEANESSFVQYVYELHLKYSFAISCFVFLFVGAPLGAIIRKGGFGYPVLASILLFATFVVLNIACKKLMRSFALAPDLAAWMPVLVIFPIGLLLTYAAMNDRKFQVPAWVTDNPLIRGLGVGYRRVLVLTGLRDPAPTIPAEA